MSRELVERRGVKGAGGEEGCPGSWWRGGMSRELVERRECLGSWWRGGMSREAGGEEGCLGSW